MGLLDRFFAAPKPEKPLENRKPNYMPFGPGVGARIGTDPVGNSIYDSYKRVVADPAPVLLYNRSKAKSGYRNGAIDLLVEGVEKDPTIKGLINNRAASVLHMDSPIMQADGGQVAQDAASLIDYVFDYIDGGMKMKQEEMLTTAIPYGLSVHEVVWEEREFALPRKGANSRRWLVPVAMQQVRPRRVGFDSQGKILINARFDNEREASQYGYTKSDEIDWWYPNPANLFVFRRYTDYDNPYGFGLMRVLFYKAWFKRNIDVLWNKYSERFTTPYTTFTADKDKTMSKEESDAVQDMADDITQLTGMVIPAGVEFKLHEIMANASTNNFSQLINYLNDEAAKLIAGQTSTTMTDRTGSMASSEVHERQALAVVAGDARVLESALNRFIAQIIEVNMPSARYKLPRVNIKTQGVEVALKMNEVIKMGVEMGANVSHKTWHRVTGIDEAQDGEPTLKAPEKNTPPSLERGQRTKDRARQRDRKKQPQTQAQNKEE